MISGLDFGKDKYQFKITRNTGADGKYYPMFMDDSLNIDPSVLNTTMDDQMNLFSMEHENKYGELMNELIEIFIPPEGATGEELELSLIHISAVLNILRLTVEDIHSPK